MIANIFKSLRKFFSPLGRTLSLKIYSNYSGSITKIVFTTSEDIIVKSSKTMTISKTENGAYSNSLQFTSGNNTLYLKTTGQGKGSLKFPGKTIEKLEDGLNGSFIQKISGDQPDYSIRLNNLSKTFESLVINGYEGQVKILGSRIPKNIKKLKLIGNKIQTFFLVKNPLLQLSYLHLEGQKINFKWNVYKDQDQTIFSQMFLDDNNLEHFELIKYRNDVLDNPVTGQQFIQLLKSLAQSNYPTYLVLNEYANDFYYQGANSFSPNLQHVRDAIDNNTYSQDSQIRAERIAYWIVQLMGNVQYLIIEQSHYRYVEPYPPSNIDQYTAGTILNPLKIQSIQNLIWLSKNPEYFDRVFEQLNDIDCSITKFIYYYGGGFLPIGNSTNRFTGAYFGNDYVLNDLYINRDVNNVGLFGYIRNGLIERLKLVNFNIIGKSSVGGLVGRTEDGCFRYISTLTNRIRGNVAGGLIGRAVDNSIVQYCSLNGLDVDGTTVGGALGSVENLDNIKYTYTSGQLTVDNNGKVGGLIGQIDGQGGLFNCYSHCNIITPSANTKTGGLIGYNWDQQQLMMADCYYYGQFGATNHKGLLGYDSIEPLQVLNSYYHIVNNSQSLQEIGQWIDLINLNTMPAYQNWDFQNEWIMGDSWPFLITANHYGQNFTYKTYVQYVNSDDGVLLHHKKLKKKYQQLYSLISDIYTQNVYYTVYAMHVYQDGGFIVDQGQTFKTHQEII